MYELYFLPVHYANLAYRCCNGLVMFFFPEFHEFIDMQNFQVTQILIAWCNKFILTGYG